MECGYVQRERHTHRDIDKQEKIEQTEPAIQTIFYLILINIGIDLLRRDFMVCKILSSLCRSRSPILFLSLCPVHHCLALVCVCVFCKIGWAVGDHRMSEGVLLVAKRCYFIFLTPVSLSISPRLCTHSNVLATVRALCLLLLLPMSPHLLFSCSSVRIFMLYLALSCFIRDSVLYCFALHLSR